METFGAVLSVNGSGRTQRASFHLTCLFLHWNKKDVLAGNDSEAVLYDWNFRWMLLFEALEAKAPVCCHWLSHSTLKVGDEKRWMLWTLLLFSNTKHEVTLHRQYCFYFLPRQQLKWRSVLRVWVAGAVIIRPILKVTHSAPTTVEPKTSTRGPPAGKGRETCLCAALLPVYWNIDKKGQQGNIWSILVT